MKGRVVAVLGYGGGGEALHPVCAARLRRAADVAGPDDVVVLSGWARRGGASESSAMHRAWRGSSARLVADPFARSTLDNVLRATTLAREVGARELVVVTSGWHARRARALARRAVRGTGLSVTVVATRERGAVRDRVRELACWAALPAQVAARRRAAA